MLSLSSFGPNVNISKFQELIRRREVIFGVLGGIVIIGAGVFLWSMRSSPQSWPEAGAPLSQERELGMPSQKPAAAPKVDLSILQDKRYLYLKPYGIFPIEVPECIKKQLTDNRVICRENPFMPF